MYLEISKNRKISGYFRESALFIRLLLTTAAALNWFSCPGWFAYSFSELNFVHYFAASLPSFRAVRANISRVMPVIKSVNPTRIPMAQTEFAGQ